MCRAIFMQMKSIICLQSLTIHQDHKSLSHPSRLSLVQHYSFPWHPVTIFQPWQKPSRLLAPVRWRISFHCDICSVKTSSVSVSPNPDFEPVGWSLITEEWAANGCLHHTPTPKPPAPHSTACLGSPWRPVVEYLGAFLRGSGWGVMIGRRTWPSCFLCHLTRHGAY